MFLPNTHVVGKTFMILAFLDARNVIADQNYGLDCSYPIHSEDLKCGNMLGDRLTFYEEHMDECRKHYGFGEAGENCDMYDQDRIEMNLRQPMSMVNYTSTGFKKIRAPEHVMELINQHWVNNQDKKQEEEWPVGNIYVNHWKSPTYMVNIDDERIGSIRERDQFKRQVWSAVKEILEPWTGMELVPSSMYGIRIYTEGAIVVPHVDRLPLVSSCMINVAQDVDEPWPLEVYDQQGNAVNITMDPGDLLLFESGSLVHGRPFPLKGRFHANLFIHFEPTGKLLYDDPNSVQDKFDPSVPPYILPDSPEIENWKSKNPYGWRMQNRLLRRRANEPDNFCFIG